MLKVTSMQNELQSSENRPLGLAEYYRWLYEAESDRDLRAMQAGGFSAVEIHPLCPALQHAVINR